MYSTKCYFILLKCTNTILKKLENSKSDRLKNALEIQFYIFFLSIFTKLYVFCSVTYLSILVKIYVELYILRHFFKNIFDKVPLL